MKPQRNNRTTLYESPWVNLHIDDVTFPNGVRIEKHHLLDFPRAAVTMLVENDAGELVFARICRYTTGLTEWELPAGGIEPGETELEAARREVLEETGYTTHSHRLIYTFYPMNGIANKLFHVVHCRTAEHIQAFDPREVDETRWFTRAEVQRMLHDHTTSDGFTLIALLLWLRGLE